MHRGSIMSTCCKTFGLQLHRGYESVTASRAHLMKVRRPRSESASSCQAIHSHSPLSKLRGAACIQHT